MSAKIPTPKERFIKLFNDTSFNHNRFTVWSDFVHMAAYAISNSCNFRQEREDKYMAIVKKYTKKESEQISELLALTVMAMESERKQDFLGQLYMEFKFGDVKKGQYFTPYEIAEMMARMTHGDYDNTLPYITVSDPACGSGVMLLAYANYLIDLKVNHHLKLYMEAVDLDPCIGLMAYIQLSLMGCAGYVCIRDSIANPTTGKVLFPPEDAYIMPFSNHQLWNFRRIFV